MMKNNITKEMFIKANEGDFLEGYIYLKDFNTLISRNENPYLSGELNAKVPISFKMFGDISMIDDSYKDTIIEAKLKVNIFNGKRQVIIMSMKKCIDETIKKEDFIYFKEYDSKEYSDKYLNLLKNKLSNEGYELLLNILEVNNPNGLYEEFTTCYAASVNHDNCKGGLLAHSYKCIRVLNLIEDDIYGWLRNFKTDELSNQNILDLIYLGTALHDIGKTKEIDKTIYKSNSFNTHRILGAEIIFKHKEEIINKYNEHFYSLLISILVGHHDVYGESSKTLYAYIVHKVDDLEAFFTDLEQRLETSILEKPNGKYLAYDNDHNLYL